MFRFPGKMAKFSGPKPWYQPIYCAMKVINEPQCFILDFSTSNIQILQKLYDQRTTHTTKLFHLLLAYLWGTYTIYTDKLKTAFKCKYLVATVGANLQHLYLGGLLWIKDYNSESKEGDGKMGTMRCTTLNNKTLSNSNKATEYQTWVQVWCWINYDLVPLIKVMNET